MLGGGGVKSKHSIRKEFKLKRESLRNNHPLQEKIVSNSKKLFKELIKGPFKENIAVSAYYPIEEEFDVLPLIDWFHENKILCALPRIKSYETKDIEFLLFGSDTEVKKNDFDIPEPHNDYIIIPAIIIVPLIACDLKGNRIGYGQGFYDKYLAKVKKEKRGTISVGICYEDQISHETLPEEPHDQKLDFIVTGKRIYRLT